MFDGFNPIAAISRLAKAAAPKRGPNAVQLRGARRFPRAIQFVRLITAGRTHCQICGVRMQLGDGQVAYTHSFCRRALAEEKRREKKARAKAWHAGGRQAAEAAWRERDRLAREAARGDAA